MQLDDEVAFYFLHEFQLVHEIADSGLSQVQHFLYRLYRVESPAEGAPRLRLPDLPVAATAELSQQIEIIDRDLPRAGLLSLGGIIPTVCR